MKKNSRSIYTILFRVVVAILKNQEQIELNSSYVSVGGKPYCFLRIVGDELVLFPYSGVEYLYVEVLSAKEIIAILDEVTRWISKVAVVEPMLCNIAARRDRD